MSKIFNLFSIITGIFGGIATYFLGGLDNLLIALLIFIVIDYLTGVIKSLYLWKLSSKIGFKGLLKKLAIIICVGVGVILETHVGIPAVREMIILFFISNEGISILENLGEMDIIIPEKLKNVLLQLREKEEN